MAWESQGAKLLISSNTTAACVDLEIGQITDFSGPGGAAAIIDVTSLQSTAKEKLVGLRDEGQLSLTMSYSATDVGQIAFVADRAARTKRRFLLKFTSVGNPSSYGVGFKGYPMQFSISGAVDNKITANGVIEITGPCSYTTY
jgi:hypothetical protein